MNDEEKNEDQTKPGADRSDEANARGGESQTHDGTKRTQRFAQKEKDPYARHCQPSAALNLIWEKARQRARSIAETVARSHPANA